MTLSSVLIDDEPLGLASLADDLANIPIIDVVGTFLRPFDALPLIQQGPVDLLFLDIQMPTLLGTDFLRAIPNPPMTIFTTAHERYALEGYELDVVDYLLKPVRFDRLLRACTKAFELKKQKQAGTATEQEAAPTFFFVKSDYKDIKIYHHDILYIEGLKNYVKIHLASQPDRPVLTKQNMKQMEAQLNPAQFCRVHQSFIVPLNRITAAHKSQVQLGNLTFPIGERYQESLLKQYHSS